MDRKSTWKQWFLPFSSISLQYYYLNFTVRDGFNIPFLLSTAKIPYILIFKSSQKLYRTSLHILFKTTKRVGSRDLGASSQDSYSQIYFLSPNWDTSNCITMNPDFRKIQSRMNFIVRFLCSSVSVFKPNCLISYSGRKLSAKNKNRN